MRSLRIIAVLAFVVMPGVALASSTPTQVWVTSACNREQYKPRVIVLACADGNTFINKLRWSKWTTSKAVGNGTYEVNTCTPSCAAGHLEASAAAVTLTKPKRCAGQKHKAFIHAKLNLGKRTKSYSVPCPS